MSSQYNGMVNTFPGNRNWNRNNQPYIFHNEHPLLMICKYMNQLLGYTYFLKFQSGCTGMAYNLYYIQIKRKILIFPLHTSIDNFPLQANKAISSHKTNDYQNY